MMGQNGRMSNFTDVLHDELTFTVSSAIILVN